jgi:hypothetical protein
MNRAEWHKPISDDEARRRAGGRARYNVQRSIVQLRRHDRIRAFYRKRSAVYRGDVRALARWLGVAPSTISRDLRNLRSAGVLHFKDR